MRTATYGRFSSDRQRGDSSSDRVRQSFRIRAPNKALPWVEGIVFAIRRAARYCRHANRRY
jgi:hypothetical protein